MRLNIQHQTQYVYSEPVNYTIQQLKLTPRNGAHQQVRHWEIKVNGVMHAHEDTFGNATHTLVIDQPHEDLLISVTGEVETGSAGLQPVEQLPIALYLRQTPLTQPDKAIVTFAEKFSGKPIKELMLAIRDKTEYLKGVTKVDTTAAQAFALGKGVCQDQTHILLSCCRLLGIPARYVSGYLFTEDGSLMQTHAWAEVWQDATWQGMDISNNRNIDETHVKLAVGLDYRSSSPVTGSRIGGGDEGMASSVLVNQSSSSPQQTKQLKHSAAKLLEAAKQQSQQ